MIYPSIHHGSMWNGHLINQKRLSSKTIPDPQIQPARGQSKGPQSRPTISWFNVSFCHWTNQWFLSYLEMYATACIFVQKYGFACIQTVSDYSYLSAGPIFSSTSLEKNQVGESKGHDGTSPKTCCGWIYIICWEQTYHVAPFASTRYWEETVKFISNAHLDMYIYSSMLVKSTAATKNCSNIDNTNS